MSAQFSPEPNQATLTEGSKDQSRSTRREGIAAAAGGVSGFLAAQSLAGPAPARASHRGAVLLGHPNYAGNASGFNPQDLTTTIFGDPIALSCETSEGLGIGVQGKAFRGTGVFGNGHEVGVRGSCDSQTGVGVLANNTKGGVAFRALGAARVVGNLKVGLSNANPALKVDAANPANGHTAILVRRNVEGALSTQRVSMGPPDSGGAGFRVLRVPN
jgi:hypothetical protein